MASDSNNNIKIHEHCHVTPPSSATKTSLPFTFFDLFWVRFHPVERVFFYSLQSDPSFFFQKLVPKLKTSLSITLQHFLPLAGNIVWPSESPKPMVQYNPGDGVSLVIAESGIDFNHVVDNSPHESALSPSFVPHLESTDSFASVMSLQITLFPESGFCIGISTHHAVFDGKSSTMFLKAWASLCQSNEESQSLVPELVPSFDREIVEDKNPTGVTTNDWIEILSKMLPSENTDKRSLKILPFQPKLEGTVRATFKLTREDLEMVKKRVLSKWEKESNPCSKPPTLSSFVLTCAYVLVCIAKAIQGVEKEKEKFAFAFTVDCRARLEPPLPDYYFGNCVWGHLVDTKPMDFVKEDGVFVVAKSIHDKIKMLGNKGIFDGAKDISSKYLALTREGVEVLGVAGSNRFGVYGIDFGWGKPIKVEIISVDRGSTIGLAETSDGTGGVEVGLVLNKNVMDLFSTLFSKGLCHD